MKDKKKKKEKYTLICVGIENVRNGFLEILKRRLVSGMLLYTFYSTDGIWQAFYTIDMQLDRCFLSTSLTL